MKKPLLITTPAACPECGNQWGPCPGDLDREIAGYLNTLFVTFEETLIENLLCAPFFVTDSFSPTRKDLTMIARITVTLQHLHPMRVPDLMDTMLWPLLTQEQQDRLFERYIDGPEFEAAQMAHLESQSPCGGEPEFVDPFDAHIEGLHDQVFGWDEGPEANDFVEGKAVPIWNPPGMATNDPFYNV